MLERLKAWVDRKEGRSFDISYSPYAHTDRIWLYDYNLRTGASVKNADFSDDILELKTAEEKRKEYEKLKAQFEGSNENA